MKIHTRNYNGHGNGIYAYPHIIPVETETQGYEPAILNHNVDLTGTILTYKLKSNETLVLDLTVDLNLIRTSPSLIVANPLNVDQIIIGITDKVIDKCLLPENIGKPYEVVSSDLINMLSTTFVSKDKIDSGLYDGNKCPFKIFVPSVNSNFKDFQLIVYADLEREPLITNTYTSDDLTLEVLPIDAPKTLNSVLSPITITSSKDVINPGDTVTLTVTTDDTSISEVYAEPVYGIITKTRITLTNGVGTVGLSALGLSSGDPIRVKFGYKYFTSKAQYTNTVA